MTDYRQLILEKDGFSIPSCKADTSGDAHVIIGLGGMGAEAVAKIKRELGKRTNSGDSVRFLVVDNDPSCIDRLNHGNIYDINPDSEYLDISVDKAEEKIHNLDYLRNQGYNSILETLQNQNEEVESDLAESRLMGYFCLLEHSDACFRAILDRIDDAFRSSKGRKLSVSIVSSLYGKTGSGILLNVCYLVREALFRFGWPNTKVSGYFFTPDVTERTLGPEKFSEALMNRAKGYATMQELHYCMNLRDNNDRFKMISPLLNIDSNNPPVDRICLLTTKDSVGEDIGIEYADLLESLGNHFITQICIEDEIFEPYRYNTRISKALILPYNEIVGYLFSKMLMDNVNDIKNRADSEGVDAVLSSVGLSYDRIISRLSAGCKKSLSFGDQMDYRMYDAMGNSNFISVCDDFYNFNRQAIDENAIKMISDSIDYANIDAKTAKESMIGSTYLALYDFFCKKNYSAKNIVTIFGNKDSDEGVMACVKELSSKLRDEMQTASSELQAAHERYEAIENALKTESQKNRKKVFESYKPALAEYYRLLQRYGLIAKAVEVIDLYSEHLTQFISEVVAPLGMMFEGLYKVAESNCEYIGNLTEHESKCRKYVIDFTNPQQKRLLEKNNDFKKDYVRFCDLLLKNTSKWVTGGEDNVSRVIADIAYDIYGYKVSELREQLFAERFEEFYQNTKDSVLYYPSNFAGDISARDRQSVCRIMTIYEAVRDELVSLPNMSLYPDLYHSEQVHLAKEDEGKHLHVFETEATKRYSYLPLLCVDRGYYFKETTRNVEKELIVLYNKAADAGLIYRDLRSGYVRVYQDDLSYLETKLAMITTTVGVNEFISELETIKADIIGSKQTLAIVKTHYGRNYVGEDINAFLESPVAINLVKDSFAKLDYLERMRELAEVKKQRFNKLDVYLDALLTGTFEFKNNRISYTFGMYDSVKTIDLMKGIEGNVESAAYQAFLGFLDLSDGVYNLVVGKTHERLSDNSVVGLGEINKSVSAVEKRISDWENYNTDALSEPVKAEMEMFYKTLRTRINSYRVIVLGDFEEEDNSSFDNIRSGWLNYIDEVIAGGPYSDNWASLSTHEVPKWYKDAKFGIFIHWGAYSVPAFNCEWYPRNMYHPEQPEYDYHIKTFGPHKEFGYKDFIPLFKAEKFNADEWAELFEASGAQYVMPVGEHHDGFQMYDSVLSDWCASKMGPMRDTLGEIKEAVEKRNMRLCVSSHRIEHWWFMGSGRKFDSDVCEPIDRNHLYWPAMPEPDFQDLNSEPAPSEEFMEDWLVRSCELVEKYHPNVFYFDWWIQHSAAKPYLKKFAAFYYNLAHRRGESAVINYKHDAFDFGAAVVDIERGQFAEAKPYIWQTDTAVAKNSWCYTVGNEYKSSVQIIRDLVDIVSKNGRLLLNIGPKSDGTIPDEDKNILLDVGKWLKVNGEAIYGATLWRQAAEGPTQITEGQFADADDKGYTAEDLRFTMANGKLYVTCLNMEGRDEIRVRALADADASHLPKFHGIIKNVTRLGDDSPVEFTRTEEALIIKTSEVTYPEPVVFCIDID